MDGGNKGLLEGNFKAFHRTGELYQNGEVGALNSGKGERLLESKNREWKPGALDERYA